MTKKEKRRETIFCIAVAIIVAVLYMSAGALRRGWVDLPGAAALMVLIAPLTVLWIRYRTANCK